VLIPALDEEHALPHVLADLARERVDLVLVVDNGSRDRTAEVAASAGACVLSEPRRGYGRACASGLELLLGRGASGIEPLAPEDIVVFLDGDRSDHVEDLAVLLAPLLADEADFVLGSRMIDRESRRALLPQARFGNALACGLMRVLFGARHTDLGPFRALRAGALAHLDLQDRGFGWTIEMQLKARVAGLRVREVPVRYRARIGTSKITGTWRGTLGASAKILGWILGWRLALWFTSRRIPRYPRPAHSGSR
jgi:glycosyltransferase involved in cell wall biosynthesis